MKLALDPHMLRSTPLIELPGKVADLGYEHIELSPREDFIPFFNHPRADDDTVAAFKQALDDAGVSIFEAEGIRLTLEPHPDDFIEDGYVAVDTIRSLNSPNVTFEYCAPHTFHQAPGGDIAGIMRYAHDLLTHVHVADSWDFNASSGLRCILNPPGTQARVHQHLDIGQGQVDWEEFFGTLGDLDFDGIMTVCVFAWEDRAEEPCIANREAIERRLKAWG